MLFYHLCFALLNIIADLQRAKPPSESLLVRNIGNPSSRENVVMTSLYERPSSAQTLWEGEGRLNHRRFRVFSINTFHIPLEVTLTAKLA